MSRQTGKPYRDYPCGMEWMGQKRVAVVVRVNLEPTEPLGSVVQVRRGEDPTGLGHNVQELPPAEALPWAQLYVAEMLSEAMRALTEAFSRAFQPPGGQR